MEEEDKSFPIWMRKFDKILKEVESDKEDN